MKKQNVIVIELTDLYVRVACFQSDRLCHFEAALRQAHKSPFQGIPIPKKFRSFPVVLVVPRREVIFKLMDLPSSQADELRRMVDIQIASLVPYAKDEIEYSLDILLTLRNGHSRVLVGVIQKERARQYFRELQSHGLQVSQIIVSSMAVVNTCISLQPKIREKAACYAILNVDLDHSELCLSMDGKVLFSKHLSAGFNKITETEQPQIVHEAMRVIHIFNQSYSDVFPKGIIISAPEACRDVLTSQFQQNSDYGVEIVDASGRTAFEGIDLSKWDDHFKFGSAAMLLGATDAEEISRLNLLPSEALFRKRTRKLKAVRNRFFLSFLFASVFFLMVLNIHSIRQRMYLSQLHEIYKELEPDLREAQRIMGVVDMVREDRSRRIYVVLVFNALFDLTPDDVTYREIQMGKDGMLSLQGESRSGGGVSLLQKNLVVSELFQDEMLRYATKRKRFREEITEFHITCRVKF